MTLFSGKGWRRIGSSIEGLSLVKSQIPFALKLDQLAHPPLGAKSEHD